MHWYGDAGAVDCIVGAHDSPFDILVSSSSDDGATLTRYRNFVSNSSNR